MPGQSSYSNLGQFAFTTAADQTGMNAGNITSVLDTGLFKAARFELYRLVIGAASIPSAGQTPMVVQTATGRAASLTTLNLTFPANTTAGNLIVVGVASWGDSANPVVSAVTLGGSADNFAVVPSTSTANNLPNVGSTSLWADPKCAGGSGALVVTASTGSGNHPNLIGFAWEVSGVVANAAVATVTDTSASSTLSGGGTSLAAAGHATTAANDILFAVSSGQLFSTDSLSWNGALNELGNQGPFTISGQANGFIFGNAGYTLIAANGGGTSETVSVTHADGGYLTQSIGAFLASTASPAPATIPFKVMVGAKTWDVQTTTAGVGYTYDPQNPMFLNQGEQISVLWTNLPSSIYSAYAKNFTVTGWFRYDPTLPGNTSY